MSVKYQYSPLENPRTHIRVLLLEPGSNLDPLRASLEHARLSTELQYQALSYCWGREADGLSQVQIRSDCGFASVVIFENLARALRRFRSTSETIRFWTDSLCIDQDTNVKDQNGEKSCQVQLMSDIYQTATKVLIYLGEKGDLPDDTFDLFQRIRDAAFRTDPGDRRKPQQWCDDHQIPRIDDHRGWRPLQELFRRAWFRRAWIIQECVFAKDASIHCGDWTIAWDDIIAVMKVIYRFGLGVQNYTSYGEVEEQIQLQQGLGQLNYIRLLKDAWTANSRFQFMDVAYKMQRANATDLRDNIFGLLNLACDTRFGAPVPVYEANNTLLRNCVSYAKYFLHAKDNLELFYRAGYYGQRLRAPSWIPNWYGSHVAFGYEPAEGIWDPARRPEHFNIAGGSQAQITVDEARALVGVRGVLIDHVKDIACEPFKVEQPIRSLEDFARHKREHLHGSDRIMLDIHGYPTGEPVRDVQWRTLICNTTHSDHREAPADYEQSYMAWRETLDPSLPFDPSRSLKASPFGAVIGGYNADKVFGSTMKGYVGMFPGYAKPQDCIVVLFGGEFPFVLRSLDTRGSSYQLIGQCYVHGLMEKKGKLDLSKFPEKQFWLGGPYEAEVDEVA